MRLYVETSVISFWFDSQARNRQKKRAVRRVLLLCARGVHEGFVSVIVRRELEVSREPFRSRDLALLDRLGFRNVAFDPDLFARLLEAYRKNPQLLRLPEGDLEHLAAFSASDLDAILTCNLHDLANLIILEAVRKVNHEKGVRKELHSGPPEAFLPPA